MIEGELRDRIDELESEVYTLEIKIEEHDKWEYKEGGWGLFCKEVNIKTSEDWFIDVYPNSNMDNKLKRERNIYIYGK